MDCLARIKLAPGGLALDLPSGAGRHIALLRTSGYEVVAADLDLGLLRLVPHAAPDALACCFGGQEGAPERPLD